MRWKMWDVVGDEWRMWDQVEDVVGGWYMEWVFSRGLDVCCITQVGARVQVKLMERVSASSV